MDHHGYPFDKHQDARRTQLEQSKADWLHRITRHDAKYQQELAHLKKDHEKGMHGLVSEIRKVNGHLNAFIPIARLPPEILAEVFTIFVKKLLARLYS